MQNLFRMKSHLFAVTVTALAYSRYSADYNYTPEFVLLYENKELGLYLPDNQIEERIKRSQQFFSQTANYKFYFTECENLERSYSSFYNSLAEDYSTTTNAELATLFTTLLHLQARCSSLYQGTNEYATKQIENQLINMLKSTTTEWQAAFQELAIATPEDIQNEESDYKKLIEKTELSDEAIEAHIKLHPWACGKAFILTDAVLEFEELMKTRRPRKIDKKIAKFEYLLENESIRHCANTLKKFSDTRIKLRRLLATKLLGSPIYVEIARRMKVNASELFYKFEADDVLQFLLSGTTPQATENRGYTWNGFELRPVFLQEFQNAKQKAIQIEKVENQLEGMPVYPGKVTGVVRVIIPDRLNAMQSSTFNEGDILVTTMTIPNMMFLIGKAAAIVTDEGGITCHASIVARELKKPCIVGTRCATKTFKEGDKIEVDAESGIVKLIN